MVEEGDVFVVKRFFFSFFKLLIKRDKYYLLGTQIS